MNPARQVWQAATKRAERILWRHTVSVYFSAQYRPPVSGIELTGFEPRRAEYALWYLLDRRVTSPRRVHEPRPASLRALAKVHEREYLASLLEPRELARIFALEPSDIRVSPAWRTLRLACGGTIEGAREALAKRSAVLNLSGGFHHASPGSGGGFCAFNDVAIAIADLRDSGFEGRVSIYDLDAHPPDGTADCLRSDSKVWIGSLSGADWGPLPGVDETVLPVGAGDESYLARLRELLSRAPRADLAFVLAGGDVLKDDPLGGLALSLRGAYERDARVHTHLKGTPAVWLAAGGYTRGAWKVLAGTGLVLSGRSHDRRLEQGYAPLRARYRQIETGIRLDELDGSDGSDGLSEDDVRADLHISVGPPRLLDVYTEQGLEYALFRYGIFELLEARGYEHFQVEIRKRPTGDNFSVFGQADGVRHLLIDATVSKRAFGDDTSLHIEWLNLRHPLASFGGKRQRLPGQDVPGLGLLPEVSEFLFRMASRLHLTGVDFCPASYHLARLASPHFRFRDSARQGRFEALIRDLGGIPVEEVSAAMADGRVRMNDEPYRWEADEMVFREGKGPRDRGAVDRERDRVSFSTVKP